MTTSDAHNPQAVALLATGDELIHGDILNTNAQRIAQRFFDEQIITGQHMVVRDNEQEIEQSLLFLLNTHAVVITIGGLGPTSDDRTRFAVAKALGLELVFDQSSWEAVLTRLKKYGITDIPESNKQQALFPKDALIFANPNGTAAGCLAENPTQDKLIIMLPGPPNECLPMFEDYVLPALEQRQFSQKKWFKHWMLAGVGEGQIAEKIENILANFPNCQPGYRVSFPYLEFKLFAHQLEHQTEFEQAVQAIEQLILPYTINNDHQKASELLLEQLALQPNYRIIIDDHCTGGYLERLIHQPNTHPYLVFNPTDKPNTTETSNHNITTWNLTVNGLDNYWQNDFSSNSSQITLTLKPTNILDGDINNSTQQLTYEIRLYSDSRTCLAAAEKACEFLVAYLGPRMCG